MTRLTRSQQTEETTRRRHRRNRLWYYSVVLIAKGKPAPSEPWRILEVATGQSPDVIALRVGKELKRIHEQGVEALVPFKRNASGEPEWIVEHVYVRGANGSLRLLARTPGIECIRKEIAPHDWIERLLSYERPEPQTLTLGTFVRILTGPCARLCGTISALSPTATVVVDMRTKRIKVHADMKQLQVVDCPPEQQTFFYNTDIF